MLDRERCEVGVRNVAMLLPAREDQALEDLVVMRAGHQNEDGLALEPLTHQSPGFGEGGGELMDPRVGGQAEERQKARSGKTDCLRSVQPIFEPARCGVVLGIFVYAVVEQQVRIDQDHRKPSPSPSSRASVTLTTSWRIRPTDSGSIS